jgi:hypothetical protein
MNPAVGCKIKFLNENLLGVIKEVLLGNKFVIIANDGFEYIVSSDEIIIVHQDNSHYYNIDSEQISRKIKTESSLKTNTEKSILSRYKQSAIFLTQHIIEIDLHLEELVEFPNRLDDWQKLHTQMQHVKKCLNAAFDGGIKKMVFIHGVGTGVLKTELRNYLSEYPNIIINDADYREYGIGATEVILK